MPKHILVILIFVLSLLTLLFLPGLFDAIFAFIFVGVIPFTNATIPPTIMMLVYAALIISGVLYLTKQSYITTSPVKREEAGRKRARKKVYRQASVRKNTSKAKVSRPKKRYQPVVGS